MAPSDLLPPDEYKDIVSKKKKNRVMKKEKKEEMLLLLQIGKAGSLVNPDPIPWW
jgi:hypothetical protein